MRSTKLTEQEVIKIAKLANLTLTEAEVVKYRAQLSDVLGYIGKLKELDTSHIEPTSQVTGLENVFRKDKVEESRSLKSKKGKYYETDAVFQEG